MEGQHAETIEGALAGLKRGFVADGADLEVVAADEHEVRLRLIGSEETCWECIVPPPVLHRVLSATVLKVYPDANVFVSDPRADRDGDGDPAA